LRLRLPPADALAKPVVAPGGDRVRVVLARRDIGTYVPLHCHSYYSFLNSTLSPAALVALAKQNGLSAVALTDTGNLHGAVEFVQAANEAGVKPILGTQLRMDGKPLLLYATSATGYHNLCRLLSRHAELGAKSGDEGSVAAAQRREIHWHELSGFTSDVIAAGCDGKLAELFPNAFYQIVTGAQAGGPFPSVAMPTVHCATAEDRKRYDILQSIRTLTLLQEQNPAKRLGWRLHFRTAKEMNAGCKAHSEWLRATLEIAERCNFEFPFGAPQFPAFVPPDGSTAKDFLYQLVLAGLRSRYGGRAVSPASDGRVGHHR